LLLAIRHASAAMGAFIFIVLLVAAIFAGDAARRWWRATEWKRRVGKRPLE